MSAQVRWSVSALCCLLAVWSAGCGGGSNLPKGATGTVRGRITFQGNPVPEGSVVTFMRESDGAMAVGKTDASGEYLLRMKDGVKIVVGEYRVSIGPPNLAENLDQDQAMEMHMSGKLKNPADVKEIPERYRSPEKSTLICVVEAGSNEFDVDMKP